MEQTDTAQGVWRLPPLILHPFAGDQGPDKLLEGSRANLLLQAAAPPAGAHHEDLTRLVLAGRYQEIRMLFYIGRDLRRWAEQCADFASREPQLKDTGIRQQSFLTLLIERPPRGMAAKLEQWGVTDQRAIFSRAIGLNSIFETVPAIDELAAGFVRSYQRYADYLYIAFQTMTTFRTLNPASFQFELYASEEYARKLSEGWD